VRAATDLTESLFTNQDLAPNQKRAYCFEKIYAGNSECSFEELRAWRYQAKKKEREEQQKHVDQLVIARVELLKVDLELVSTCCSVDSYAIVCSDILFCFPVNCES
jgi:hypothetical protein